MDRWAPRAAALVLALALVLGLATVGDYGATTDETLRMLSSWRWWDALARGDLAGLPDDVRANYGVLFDLLGQLAWTVHHNMFGGTDEFLARHVLCLLTGWLGLLGTHALARRLLPQPLPLVALLLLLLAPRWYGASFTNPKDIPFATAWVWSMVALVDAARAPGTRSTLRLAALTAVCAAVRPFGALLVPLGLATLALTARGAGRERLRWLARQALALLGVALALTVLLWPVLWTRPPWHLVRAIAGLSRNIDGSPSLFFGTVYPHDAAPAAYAAVWLTITLPALTLLGLAAGAIAQPRALLRARPPLAEWWPWALVGLWIAVPVAAPAVVRIGLYDTVRHLLFVVPALCVVAAAGLGDLARRLLARSRALAGAAGLVAALSAGEVAWRMVHLHPYEQLYFGPLVGGLAGAHGRFDVAHYSETYREGLGWLRDHAGPGVVHVHMLGNGSHTASFYAWKLGLTLNRPTFEYFVSEVRQGWEDHLPGAVVHTIAREGVPLLVVKRLDPIARSTSAWLRDEAGRWRSAPAVFGVFAPAPADTDLALPLASDRAARVSLYLRYHGGLRVWSEEQVVLDLPRVPGPMVASTNFPSLVRLDVELAPGLNWLRFELGRTDRAQRFGVYFPAAPGLSTPELATYTDPARSR